MNKDEQKKIYVTVCDFRLQELYTIANNLSAVGLDKAGLAIGVVCGKIEKVLRPLYKEQP